MSVFVLPKRKTISPEMIGFRPYLEDAEAFEEIIAKTGADKSQALREALRDYLAKIRASHTPPPDVPA